MPSHVMGFGTRFYGERDREPDGSYITTEWIIFCMIPILPLHSYRVTRVGAPRSTGTFPFFGFSQQYTTREVPLNCQQVLNFYGVIAAGIAATIVGFAEADFLVLHPGVIMIVIGTFFLVFLGVLYLRAFPAEDQAAVARWLSRLKPSTRRQGQRR